MRHGPGSYPAVSAAGILIPKEFAAKEKLEIVLSAPVPAFTFQFRSGKQGEAGGRGGGGGGPAAPERSAGEKRRRISSVQKMFEQSRIIPYLFINRVMK